MPTGGNMEPLGPRRAFGDNAGGTNVDPNASGASNGTPIKTEPKEIKTEERSSEKEKDKGHDRESSRRKHKHRDRSRSPHKRDKHKRERRSKRSRSRDKERRSTDRDDERRSKRSRRSRSKSKEKEESKPSAPPIAIKLEPIAPPMPLTVAVPGQAAVKTEPEDPTKKKRRSRWGAEKAYVPGMPTMLPSNMTEEQTRCYLLQLQIEDISRKIRAGDYGIHPDPTQRSPSPEPVYDVHGKRLNTREVRVRQRLEKQRHDVIQDLWKINPTYKPPPDYKAPVIKLHEKVWIPQEDNPQVNFVGLLIGPRGNTLKSLERETGARIIIRGKGSVKEGKLIRPGPLPGENEPLHAYITATDPETIEAASKKIKEIIEQALEMPDSQNELRKLQLRELAVLNGTLRPEDFLSGGRCSNCGATTHKSWECPDAPNVTANVICTQCGGAGHIAKDCKNPRPGVFLPGAAGPGMGLDDEYDALMAELGQESDGYGRVPLTLSNTSLKGQQGESMVGRGGEPIVRINLAATQRPKAPPSLLNMDVAGPPGGHHHGGMPPMPPPPWAWPPMPPMDSSQDQGSMGYPPMMGMPPMPPMSMGEMPVSSSEGSMPPPPPMFPPWGMPLPVPPPPGSGGQPPPPPPPMDLTALLTPPAPPPPPPE